MNKPLNCIFYFIFKEQSDRLLVMYPATLIILSEENDGLFYKVTRWPLTVTLNHITSVCLSHANANKSLSSSSSSQGKLPLNMITVTTPCQDVKPNTFKIEGTFSEAVSCFKGPVKEIVMDVDSSACVTLSGLSHVSTGVTVHNPLWMSWFYPQNDNLTVAHSSKRTDRMTSFVSPPLPLPPILSPPFLLPGKLINPIVVSCLDRTEFCDWIHHFKAADVPVLTPPPPVYDIIYTPTHREVRHALLLKKQLDFSQPHMNHNHWGSYCILWGRN